MALRAAFEEPINTGRYIPAPTYFPYMARAVYQPDNLNTEDLVIVNPYGVTIIAEDGLIQYCSYDFFTENYLITDIPKEFTLTFRNAE